MAGETLKSYIKKIQRGVLYLSRKYDMFIKPFKYKRMYRATSLD